MLKLSSSKAAEVKASIDSLLARIGALIETNPPVTFRCPDCLDRGLILTSRWIARFKYRAWYGQRCQRCLERAIKQVAARARRP